MNIETAISTGFIFLLGLCVGSFLNVLIYRIPLKEPFVAARSRCPRCSEIISWYDNIPLVSFILLHGRCRHCRESISWRYPVVELSAGLLFVAVFLNELDPAHFDYRQLLTIIAYLFFVSTLLCISFIDVENKIIPNKITYPGLIVGVLLLPIAHPDLVLSYLIGIVIGGGLLLIIALIKSSGMGGGDIKMGAMLGIFLGLNIIPALFIAFMTGAIVGILLSFLKNRSIKDPIAFGPFLALGGLTSYFYGSQIIDSYLNLFVR